MNTLEIELRISIIRNELLKIAETLGPDAGRVVRYAANVLGLFRR